MINSGRSMAKDCMAVAESLEPILLNIASEATVVIPLTNSVMSELDSCDSTGGNGTHVFRYLSLPEQQQQHTVVVVVAVVVILEPMSSGTSPCQNHNNNTP